jgi:squalene synthase HpnC
VSVDHYENFPVASWLCPRRLRPAVKAIYWFARTADDLADEGDVPSTERLACLTEYRAALQAALHGSSPKERRWPEVFGPLALAQRQHGLDGRHLHHLLDAFEQDVRNPPYADRTTLLDYCRRSANPIGRLLLQLYGIEDAQALRESDAVCTALQLINFWQDLGLDLARGRCYAPAEDLHRHGLARERLQADRDTAATRALVSELCQWSGSLMAEGAPLAHRLPGRAGWELRLVVQGGLRILEKIRRMDHATLSRRPVLKGQDVMPLLLRAISMRPSGRVPA